MRTEIPTTGRPRAFDEETVLGRAANEAALEERLSRAAEEGDLLPGVDHRALARLLMALSEGFAVHTGAGASREDLQVAVGIALRVLAPSGSNREAASARSSSAANPG